MNQTAKETESPCKAVEDGKEITCGCVITERRLELEKKLRKMLEAETDK